MNSAFIQFTEFIIRRAYEGIYVWIARGVHILTGGKIISDVEKYSEFMIDVQKLIKRKRSQGISGFYRVKNDGDLLKSSVESHIKYLDEVIIVYNDCSDNTPDIAKSLQEKYPDKVKAYEYIPKVHPVLSKKHMLELGKSPHSIVNFYNFTLSKTTKRIVVKIDADHIAIGHKFKKVIDHIKKYSVQKKYYFFHGVNIFECKEGICINKKNPFTFGLDCGFFDVSLGMYFVHRRKYESLKIPVMVYLRRKNLGVLFYHLKGFKKDRGTAFLEGTIKDSKKEVNRIIDVQLNPDLVEWNKFNDIKLEAVPHPKKSLNNLMGL
jgi:glycosyltransferase involved in cell wall biosynthesis